MSAVHYNHNSVWVIALSVTAVQALIPKPLSILKWIFIEPWHEISNKVGCATSKGLDQPVHTRSLIRAFASRLSILWILSYWLNIIWSF